jgi:hypothetical protein
MHGLFVVGTLKRQSNSPAPPRGRNKPAAFMLQFESGTRLNASRSKNNSLSVSRLYG